MRLKPLEKNKKKLKKSVDKPYKIEYNKRVVRNRKETKQWQEKKNYF